MDAPFIRDGDRVTLAGYAGVVSDVVGIRCWIDFDCGNAGWYRRDDPRIVLEPKPNRPLTAPRLRRDQ
jgi:hypothetical protein